jgi:hypothetical protein
MFSTDSGTEPWRLVRVTFGVAKIPTLPRIALIRPSTSWPSWTAPVRSGRQSTDSDVRRVRSIGWMTVARLSCGQPLD